MSISLRDFPQNNYSHSQAKPNVDFCGKSRMDDRMKEVEPPLIQNLLKLAKAYAAHKGLGLGTVGRYAHGSSDIFEKLETGAVSVTLKKYDMMIAYLDKMWPEDLKRPKLKEPFA